MGKLTGPPLLGDSWEEGKKGGKEGRREGNGLHWTTFRVPTSLPRPFRPRPPQQPTTEGGDGETKPSQGPTDGSRPEPQRPRNRPYFQRRRQQPPGPRQPTAQEVRTLDCLSTMRPTSPSPFFPLSFLSLPLPFPLYPFPLLLALPPSHPLSCSLTPNNQYTAGSTSGRYPHP